MQRTHARDDCRLTLLIATALAAACGEAATRVEPVEVRDSAGIRIVMNNAPASTERWTVDAEPTVTVGGNEDDSTQTLFRVTGGVVLANERIVVTHGPAPMIRWYDGAGNYLFGAGRPGGGPGEFGSGEGAWISTLWDIGGDSVATWEHPARRMQVFDGGGKFTRAIVLDLPPEMPVGSYPQMIGPLRNGFVTFLIPPSQPGIVGEVTRDALTYMRYQPSGAYAGEIVRAPGFTTFTRMLELPDGREVKVDGRPPFSEQPVAWPSGDFLIYGSNQRYELAVYDTTGALSMLIRRSLPRQALTAETIEAYKVDAMSRAPDDPATRRRWENELNSAPYPDRLPAYRRIRVDQTGTLWVNAHGMPGADSTTWSVFDADGRWLSDIVLPEAWQILDIGQDYILALTRDELDIERVQKRRLHRR
jgi:hypothetical protein